MSTTWPSGGGCVYACRDSRQKAYGYFANGVRMGYAKFDDNGSLYQKVLVGQAQPDAQFSIVWTTSDAVKPEPYDPLSFPGKTCGAPK